MIDVYAKVLEAEGYYLRTTIPAGETGAADEETQRIAERFPNDPAFARDIRIVRNGDVYEVWVRDRAVQTTTEPGVSVVRIS